VRKVRDVWEWLKCMHVDTSEGGAVMSRCGFRSVRYLEVKIRGKKANVLQVWDFQSVTRALSALGSVSASRSVRSGRFYCISLHIEYMIASNKGCVREKLLTYTKISLERIQGGWKAL